LFSNMKSWLIGTHHGVSTKHLPRYLREWSYRFNRRGLATTLKKSVPRRLGWVVTCSRGQPQVELAHQQVDHRLEVADRAVAAGLRLGGLHQAVDALDQAVGDLAVEPAQDAVPVTLDGMCGIDDRLEPAMGGPEIPFLEVARRGFGGGLVVEFLERQPDLVGPRGLQMTCGETVERRLLPVRQVGRVAQPYIACAAQQ